MSQSLAGRAGYLQLAPFSPTDWFSQYLQTYRERDLTRMVNVKDMSAFRRLLKPWHRNLNKRQMTEP